MDIERIRTLARSNPTLLAIAEHFSSVSKTHSSAAVRSIEQAFYKKKNFGHKRVDIVASLELLAEHGVGRYIKGSRGEGKLVNMIIPANELGALIVGDSKNLKRYQTDRKARNIEGAADAVRTAASELKVYPMRQASSISITLTINGKPVILPLPPDLNPDQLSALLERLKRVEDGYDPRKK